MRIIQPYQISSEILNLINKAEKYIVLVSPYVNFNNWGAIKQEIKKAKKKGIKIEFITRFDVDNNKSWEQIEELGIKPKLVKNLHAKLYYNEKSGIVTSMNLLTSSNLSAIEFGAIYDTENEVKELKYFVKQFLTPHFEAELPSDDDLYLVKEKFIYILESLISETIDKRTKCKWQNGEIHINAKSQFTIGLDIVKKQLSISGIISGNESDDSKNFINKFNNQFSNYTTSLNQAVGYLSSILSVSKKAFSSDNFNFLKVNEKKEIINVTCQFIDIMLKFKEESYIIRKNARR